MIKVAFHQDFAHPFPVVTEAYYKRNLEALKDVLDRVAQSCVADRVMGEFMYKKAKGLQKHLEVMVVVAVITNYSCRQKRREAEE